mgnify:CR=1 FL=1
MTGYGQKRNPAKTAIFCVCCLYWMVPLSSVAGDYTESAHGDSTAGVERTSTALSDYSRGNCAHCHEQHASIAGSEPVPDEGTPSSFAVFSIPFKTSVTTKPYARSDVFCFQCHASTGSLQSGGVVNYDYAKTFGGATGGEASIMDQFNQPNVTGGSYHNLYDIWKYAKDNFSFFTEDSSPCVACHNPHNARRNKEHVTDPSYAAISKPTDHSNLWGDDEGEQMDDFAAKYQEPYHYHSTTTYEPGGVADGQDDGSLTPDYDSLCLDCHFEAIYSTTLGRYVVAIDWSTTGGDAATAGDKHGHNDATEDVVSRPPYNSEPGFVLSCLNCHEAHGSPNGYLVRRAINGENLGATIGTGRDGSARGNQCRQCHKDDAEAGFKEDGVNQWKSTHHGGGQSSDNPYHPTQVSSCGCHPGGGSQGGGGVEPIPCEYCHGHGKYVDANNPGTVDMEYSGGTWTVTIPAPANAPYTRKTF